LRGSGMVGVMELQVEANAVVRYKILKALGA